MANGTIAFDTLSTSGQISGTAKSVDTDYLASGSAKQWSYFNHDTPAIVDSFNTGSITDVSVGRYNISLTNNFAGATTYTSATMAEAEAANTDCTQYTLVAINTSSLIGRHDIENNAARDAQNSGTMTFGDLA